MVTPRPHAARQRGLTLVELIAVVGIAALVFAALNSVVMLGLNAQAAGSAANDHVYRAGFALERIVSKTRAAPARFVTATAGDRTGEWLAPVMYCLSTTSPAVMETTPEDTSCTGGTAVVDGVTAFSAQLEPSTRPIDTPVISYSLTVAPTGAAQPITVTASVRLGGGTQ